MKGRCLALCLVVALCVASGAVRAESELELLRAELTELRRHQQETDAELDRLRARLEGEDASSAAPVASEDVELGELAQEPGPFEHIDFHGHLSADYVGIANASAGSVDRELESDAELLPRSSFTVSDLTFFVGLPLRSDLYVATEVEFEGGGDEITLDQAFVQWDALAGERLSLRAGKFYFPFGVERFYQNAPTNPLVDRPAPALFVLPGTYADTGLQLRGSWPLARSPEMFAELELALVNGLGEAAFASVREARQSRDNNSGKSWGGRLGVVWDRWLKLGVSGLSGTYDDSNGDALWAVGADLRAEWETFELRAEWLQSRVDNPAAVDANGMGCPTLPCDELEPPLTPLGGSFRRRGWYVEGLWRPERELPGALGRLAYVLRYDALDDDQNLRQVLDGQRVAAGVVWSPLEHLRVKIEYEVTDDESDEVDNNGFLLQGAVDW